MHNVEGGRAKEDLKMAKCCELRCFRAVFLDDHFDEVKQQGRRAKGLFLGGTVAFALGVIGFGMYVVVIAGRCYGECEFHAWIPSYLLIAALAEMAHTPAHFNWLFERDPDDRSFTKFDVYRLVSWSMLISVSIFGSMVVFPHVTDFPDLWHRKRSGQCPCFYWSFWWLTGTWFSLLFTFSFNWLLYVITPCMNRMADERSRRYYERHWAQYDEEIDGANHSRRPDPPTKPDEQDERIPLRPKTPKVSNIKTPKPY